MAGPQDDPALLDVPPALFAAQLQILREQAHPMALSAFERARRAGRLPARAVAVTFDDGYADNLHAALPCLEATNVPATVFVTTGGIGSNAEYWWDALARVCFAPHRLPASLQVGDAGHAFHWVLDETARAARGPGIATTTDARTPMYAALSAWLRVRPPAVQRAIMGQLHEWGGMPADARPTHRALRVDELQLLAQSPLVEIGAHSVTHPVLGLRPADEQRREVQDSRDALAHWLGAAPQMWAYPFGEGDAVTRVSRDVVRSAGFAAAFTTDARATWRWNDAMAVPRFAMQAWAPDEFARRLTHWFEA